MAGIGRYCLFTVALLMGLAFGLPFQGLGVDTSPGMNVDAPMAPGGDGCDHPGKGVSCQASWCALCPARSPAGLVMVDDGGTTVPAAPDEHGHGLTVRPHPPPPRLLLRA